MRRLAVRGLSCILGGAVKHNYSIVSKIKHNLSFSIKRSIRNSSQFGLKRENWPPERRGLKMSSALEDSFALLTEDKKNELKYEIEVPVIKVPKQKCDYYLQLFSKYVGALHRQFGLTTFHEGKRRTH